MPPITPFLNAAVFNRGGVGRGVIKPHLQQQTNFKKPAITPTLPVNNGEILSKLAKLIPEFSNPEKSTINSNTLVDLLRRGLNKQTEENFHAALETLAVNIGKEGFNQSALRRVFEYAFLNQHYFSSNPKHLENIIKWQKEDPTNREGRKRDLAETPSTNNNAAHPSAAKRARIVTVSQRNYNVVDVGLQVEVLQEELVAVKEELRAVRDQHKREISFLYQHLGLTLPAPPTPEPQEVEEHEGVEHAHSASEIAEHTESVEHVENTTEGGVVESTEEKVGEVEMAEPAPTNGSV